MTQTPDDGDVKGSTLGSTISFLPPRAVHCLQNNKMDLPLPTRLGIWRLGHFIHRSDAFAILLAQPVDARLSPRWDYVIKVALNDQGRVGIKNSIDVGTSVRHPNLVAMLDSDDRGETPFLVMPRIEGSTLQRRIECEARQPLPVILWIARQLCQALEAMHRSGWIHRDIKPANISVGNNGHVTLLDLGFAHRGDATSAFSFVGTPNYAAPETMISTERCGPASDMFSVGRVLWECLAATEILADSQMAPVVTMIDRLTSDDPSRRPSASETIPQLLRLEMDTLGDYVSPNSRLRAA